MYIPRVPGFKVRRSLSKTSSTCQNHLYRYDIETMTQLKKTHVDALISLSPSDFRVSKSRSNPIKSNPYRPGKVYSRRSSTETSTNRINTNYQSNQPRSQSISISSFQASNDTHTLLHLLTLTPFPRPTPHHHPQTLKKNHQRLSKARLDRTIRTLDFRLELDSARGPGGLGVL